MNSSVLACSVHPLPAMDLGLGNYIPVQRKYSGRMGVLQQWWSISVHGWVCVLPLVSFWRKFGDQLRSALSWRNRRPSNGMEVHFLCQRW